MKYLSLVFTLIVSCNLGAICQSTSTTDMNGFQKWISVDKEKMRASKDQQVLMVITKVKNEKKEAFDKWIKEIFYSAIYSSKKEMHKAQIKCTRWLEPVQQNEDKTWTYAWIMDPFIPNADYNFPIFLEEIYGKEKGKQHWEMYLSFLAAPSQGIRLNQTGY